ncbi:hypothetical protein [Arthrobacter sp. NA-172]|uniref:hypothetical protein n=1 Tax=Arthrobacter sp. NA-172 TaxID=3367524 RepID=UPI003754A337
MAAVTMTANDVSSKRVPSSAGIPGGVDVDSPRLTAIVDAVLNLQGQTPADERDPGTGTRRFASSEVYLPAPEAPLATDVPTQVPARGRRRAEPVRNQWLYTLFPSEVLMLQIPGDPDKQIEQQARGTRWHPSDSATACGFSTCLEHCTGLRLLHFADKVTAVPGDTLSYSVWIINETGEDLTSVTLVPRSFTNSGLEDLSYATGPSVLCFGPLPAGEQAECAFTYVVTENDRSHTGELISAMAVEAVTASGRSLWDEYDAITPLA